jgi:hypothetical protein
MNDPRFLRLTDHREIAAAISKFGFSLDEIPLGHNLLDVTAVYVDTVSGWVGSEVPNSKTPFHYFDEGSGRLNEFNDEAEMLEAMQRDADGIILNMAHYHPEGAEHPC